MKYKRRWDIGEEIAKEEIEKPYWKLSRFMS